MKDAAAAFFHSARPDQQAIALSSLVTSYGFGQAAHFAGDLAPAAYAFARDVYVTPTSGTTLSLATVTGIASSGIRALNLVGRHAEAIELADASIHDLEASRDDVNLPEIYAGKIEALLALHRLDDARSLIEQAERLPHRSANLARLKDLAESAAGRTTAPAAGPADDGCKTGGMTDRGHPLPNELVRAGADSPPRSSDPLLERERGGAGRDVRQSPAAASPPPCGSAGPPDTQSPSTSALHLNAWFPDRPAGDTRLLVGAPARLLVNVGPKRAGAAESQEIAADAVQALWQVPLLNVLVLCAGADVDPPCRHLVMPPDPKQMAEFTLVPRRPGELDVHVILLIHNEPIHRMQFSMTAVASFETTDIAAGTSFRSEPPDPAKAGREQPSRDSRHTIQIVADGTQLEVTIRLALDRAQPDEGALSDALASGEPAFAFSYGVELDLKTERQLLLAALESAYTREGKQTIREQLLAKELVVLRGAKPDDTTCQLDDLLAKAMMPIALQGRSVHRRLFSPRQLHHFSGSSADLVRKALRSALRRDSQIAMGSSVQLFPWMFLYDDDDLLKDDRTTLKLDRFWGFRHQIQDEIKGTSGNVLLANPPQIAAAISPDVDAGEHRTGPLAAYAKVAPGHLQWIEHAAQLRDQLKRFSGDCLYFFGHARQNDPPTPLTSVLTLDGQEVTVEEIRNEGEPAFSQPLVVVFLNGCGTTPLNTWDENSFAGQLCCRNDNRVCCVTSFARVPEAFGRRFAQRFWSHFLLEKQTLGAALLHARRDLLDEFNNPLGLLYTLFGRIETRLG